MPELVASFFLVLTGALAVLFVALRATRTSLSGVSLFVFSVLFYVLAPVIQLSASMDILVNTDEFSWSAAVYTNVILFVFLLSYAVAYKLLTTNRSFHSYEKFNAQVGYLGVRVSFINNFAILGAFVLALAVAFRGIENTIISLFIFKFLALIAFFGACVYFLGLKGQWGQKSILLGLAFLFLLIVLLLKNPMFERRNAIGPIYLAIGCLALPALVQGRKFLLFGILVMVLAFPASSLLTHQYGISDSGGVTIEQVLQQIKGHYNDLHYDAWANGLSMQKMIADNGHTLGAQLLGALLFFVPRSVWPEKPVSSGEMLGQYLMENASLWFSNISFSLPFEFYLGFGLLGVSIAAVGMALFVAIVESKASESVVWHVFLIYFSFYIYFLMRGPFLPALAYLVPVFFACWLSGKVFLRKVYQCE
ncbi:hypothetical protein [Methylophaga sp.]|uniref:hypothetical protein n=1 Tax=Methylophaga sp. TaxID=2024840 RepID=UPI003A908CA5